MEDLWIAQAPLKHQCEERDESHDDAHAAAEGPVAEKRVHSPQRSVSVCGSTSIDGGDVVVSDGDTAVEPLAHQSSESSLSSRFVQPIIDLPPCDRDEYISNRTSDSPVQADLFVVPAARGMERESSPSRPARDMDAPSAGGAVSMSPGALRHAQDAVLPSESEIDSDELACFYGDDGDDDNDDDGDRRESSRTNGPIVRVASPLPTLPGGAYDSCAEGAGDESTYDDDYDGDETGENRVSELESGGFFGRIAWVLQRTREDINALLGCGGGAGGGRGPVGCTGAGRSMISPHCRELSFEDIDEVKFLGSGATGCVFLGMHAGEKVAVKKFKDFDTTAVEAKILSRLEHPNIVRFIGVCTTPPVFCIVMEFCPKTLYEVIKHTRIPPTQICEWARQIAHGMQYLHEQNQVHRDLKSPNVLLAQDKRTLKISDFGTARKVGSRSLSEKTMCGSPPWMAPELIRNEPYGKTADVWSYGVVLWELLTGEVPYHGVEQGAIIFGVAMKSLHLPVPSTTPLGFSLLLKQCWNTAPKHRPQFRQILLHLDILLEDSGFADVPVEAYFATQLKWKEEMKAEFEKMKQEEMEIRRTDKELLERREEELQHAQDIRRLYEARLQAVSQILGELRARERDLSERRFDKRGVRRQRTRALVSSPSGRAFSFGMGSRRRSKEGLRASASRIGVVPEQPESVGTESGSTVPTGALAVKGHRKTASLGSPGSPLALSAIRDHRRSTFEPKSPSEKRPPAMYGTVPTISTPVFPAALRSETRQPAARAASGGLAAAAEAETVREDETSVAVVAGASGLPSVIHDELQLSGQDDVADDEDVVVDEDDDGEEDIDDDDDDVADDPPPVLAEPSEGWFSPHARGKASPKKKWIGMTPLTSVV